ncbi:MAG: DUF2934 domain-containing protein [Candidatus Thiodiazotropha sp. (ex Codakia orbicularis)]|nr:DUF2934 domain-containing protein [Candidatus Thiodiazotropha taylori]MBV2095034.1 DUF2934 domain-containing protein [Candidatus Thiodiazotropha sp. (ex Codakia orbicularis)]
MAKKSEKDKEKKEKKAKKKLKKAGEKSSKKGKGAGKKSIETSTKERLEMIATAAYYIAQKHGFDPQRAREDWHEAEQQIDAMLESGEAD